MVNKGKISTYTSDIALIIMGSAGISVATQDRVLQIMGMAIILILAYLDVKYPEIAGKVQEFEDELPDPDEDETA